MTTLVRVYRNLNNGKISILDKKTNKVVGYAKSCFVIPMDNQTTIKCVVLEGGRNRVLRDKQKNVHAFNGEPKIGTDTIEDWRIKRRRKQS